MAPRTAETPFSGPRGVPPLTVAVVLHVVGALVQLATSEFPNRYRVHPCSLTPHPTEPCQLSGNSAVFESTNEKFSTGRIPLLFGETNCTVELRGCKPGLCYSLQDASDTLTPMDPQLYQICNARSCRYRGSSTAQPPAYYSIFSGIQAISGASEHVFSRYGFAFRPQSTAVTLQYSTQMCGTYYANRGRSEQQLCGSPIQAITVLGVEFATSIPCACEDQPSCTESP